MSDRAELREAETAFRTFWAAYPRKVAKLSASIAFVKAFRKTTLPVKLEALGWQCQTPQWQRGVIPNASTWLHQERWTDERPAIPPPKTWQERNLADAQAYLDTQRRYRGEVKQ